MEYEWDSDKARSNVEKHGIHFSDAVAVFNDEFAITIEDEYVEEERFIIIGADAFGDILVVIYTWRGDDKIRIISARKSTKNERKQYEG